MQPRRVLLVTGNERYGEFLQSRLEEKGFSTGLLAEENAGGSRLSEVDLVVLDAHAKEPKGRCMAVQRIRAVREKHSSGTPFIILTWVLPRDVVNVQLARNPFIGRYYKKSCRFLRFPVSPGELVGTFEEVQPCTEEKINEGKRFLDYIDRVHRTSAQ